MRPADVVEKNEDLKAIEWSQTEGILQIQEIVTIGRDSSLLGKKMNFRLLVLNWFGIKLGNTSIYSFKKFLMRNLKKLGFVHLGSKSNILYS